MVCLHCSTPDSYADADSWIEMVTMGVSRMALGLVLNGCRTHMSHPRYQPRNVIIKFTLP